MAGDLGTPGFYYTLTHGKGRFLLYLFAHKFSEFFTLSHTRPPPVFSSTHALQYRCTHTLHHSITIPLLYLTLGELA
jgi:hypothetical protein